jgi:hypothetical protein
VKEGGLGRVVSIGGSDRGGGRNHVFVVSRAA